MKLGICAGLKDFDKIKAAKDAGFDYIETNFSAFANASDEDRAAFVECLRKNDIKCEAMNCFIGLKVVGNEFDEKAVKEYIDRAFDVCSRYTDCEIVVFGSGGARKVPEGFDKAKAMEQFEYVCREFVEPACAKHGKYTAIENLNKGETNILNTDAEINALVNKMGLPHVKLLSDNYHMAREDEPYDVIRTFGKNLVHAHIANPEGRLFPQPEDKHDYAPFFDAMKAIGYDKRVSVEAEAPKDIPLEEAMKKSVECLRQYI